MSNSQSGQDLFTLNVLNHKKNGYFLEIGSNDPIYINNTYLFEISYNWKGIMVEYDKNFLESYKNKRINSHFILEDATKINYLNIFKEQNVPQNIDYLQIDLEVTNGSTIETLKILKDQVFSFYKFAVVTFEHDIYRGDFFNTRNESRQIFKDNGYILVFGDVKYCDNPFEDWYIHPDLVNMDYINKIKSSESLDYSCILSKL